MDRLYDQSIEVDLSLVAQVGNQQCIEASDSQFKQSDSLLTQTDQLCPCKDIHTDNEQEV